MRSPFRILADQQGVAATEFALIAPILALLLLGAVELSNVLIADAKMRAVSSSVSDLLTQNTTGTVTDAFDMKLLNDAAGQIIAPLAITGSRLQMRVIDYAVTVSGSNLNAAPRWVRSLTPPSTINTNNGACNALPALPTTLRATTLNDVVRVDTSYRWTPMFFRIFSTDVTLRTTNYNMPRFSLSLSLATGLPKGCS